jgi:ABC-type phosphate/phosphonate transport system permease subunit
MMERSSKFLSLAGWAGIMAGIYALLGAYIAKYVFDFNSDEKDLDLMQSGTLSTDLLQVIFLAIIILILAIGTAVFLSYRKSSRRKEQLWNPTSKRMLLNMAIPLVAGGLLILILISKGLISLIAPFTLLFYGLALYSASKFTYEEVRSLGLIQIGLGLCGAYFVEYGLLLWALGFGVFHIIYGIYMHYKYER